MAGKYPIEFQLITYPELSSLQGLKQYSHFEWHTVKNQFAKEEHRLAQSLMQIHKEEVRKFLPRDYTGGLVDSIGADTIEAEHGANDVIAVGFFPQPRGDTGFAGSPEAYIHGWEVRYNPRPIPPVKRIAAWAAFRGIITPAYYDVPKGAKKQRGKKISLRSQQYLRARAMAKKLSEKSQEGHHTIELLSNNPKTHKEAHIFLVGVLNKVLKRAKIRTGEVWY